MGIFKREKIDTDHIKVVLKPIFGIKPRVYIPLIYSAILVLIVSLLIIGAVKRSSHIKISSSPTRAAVYVDGKRVGSTPLTIKESGDIIEIKKNYFKSEIISSDTIKGKPKHLQLKSTRGLDILNEGYRDLSNWSLISSKNFTFRNRMPNLFSNSIIDYLNCEDFNREIADEYIFLSIKNVTNDYIFRDYLRGLLILNSDNKMPSVSSIKNSVLDINSTITKMPNSPILFYKKLLKDLNVDKDLSDRLFKDHEDKLYKSVISFGKDKKEIRLGNLIFNHVPESNIKPLDVKFIHNIKQDEFYISKTMITKEMYDLFLNDNPKWNKENIETLIDEDLVDRYYLDFTEDENYITNISYYAALEWCNWANTYYNIPKGYRLTLPTENMWHAAVLNESVDEVEAWQWTSEGFFLYDHFLANSKGQFYKEFTPVKSRLVVGNNKYNNKKESGRGVQDAAWCTPFLSFRPVLIKE